MRIIAGEFGGRRLSAPKGDATRPTSDRVRESLFSILGQPDANVRVLDLFAGAGSLGLEAISRGALSATFVESSKKAAAVLAKNIASLGLSERSEIIASKLPRALERLLDERQFDWVFVDPPYQSEARAPTLARLVDSDLLSEKAIVVVEHDRRRPPDQELGSLVRTDRRRYGDTEISIFQRGD